MIRIFVALIAGFLFSQISLAAEDAPPPASETKENLIHMENTSPKESVLQQPQKEVEKKPGVDEKPHFFFSDTRAFSLYTGGLYSLSQTDSTGYGMFGISYMWHSERRFHLETAFDVFSNQESHLRIMAKWIANLTSDVRPYAMAGLGIKILPTDNLGVIVAWSRISGHLHAGFDFSLSQHWSIKAEVFAGLDQSLNSYFGILTGPVISY